MKRVKSSRQLGLLFVMALGLLLTGCGSLSDGQTHGLLIFGGIVAALALVMLLYRSIKDKKHVYFDDFFFLFLLGPASFFAIAWLIGFLFVSLYNSLSPYPILLFLAGGVVVALIAFLVIRILRPPDVERLKSKGNIKGLIKALGYKKDWAIRVAAAKALVGIGGKAIEIIEANKQVAVEPLVAALEDADYRLRGGIADTLDTLGWEPDTSEAGFWYWVGKRNWNRASTFGPPVINKLADLVANRVLNTPDRAGIAIALGHIGDPGVVGPLLAILKNEREDDSVRRAAAKSLVGIGVDDAENSDLLRLALFEDASTTDPDAAVQALFEKALLAAPILTIQMIERQYEDIVRGRSWGSNELVKGSAEEMRTIILNNLRRYKKEAFQFKEFIVACVIYARAAQVSTIFGDRFTPIRIWRTAHSYYVCGTSNFNAERSKQGKERQDREARRKQRVEEKTRDDQKQAERTTPNPQSIKTEQKSAASLVEEKKIRTRPYQPGQREPEEYIRYIGNLVKQKNDNTLNQIVVLVGFADHEVVNEVLGQIKEIDLHTDHIKIGPQFGDRNPLIELRYDDSTDQNLIESDARALKGWGATDISAVGISQETLREFQYWYGEKACPFLVARPK